jgi:hypothetical protein
MPRCAVLCCAVVRHVCACVQDMHKCDYSSFLTYSGPEAVRSELVEAANKNKLCDLLPKCVRQEAEPADTHSQSSLSARAAARCAQVHGAGGSASRHAFPAASLECLCSRSSVGQQLPSCLHKQAPRCSSSSSSSTATVQVFAHTCTCLCLCLAGFRFLVCWFVLTCVLPPHALPAAMLLQVLQGPQHCARHSTLGCSSSYQDSHGSAQHRQQQQQQ